ncbi:hypothetical protein F5890DRAFT_1477805 [Lentinula detonsa]|uniref:Uncharacterized protein n=1 Tax=Lentinula detonsa TaxID=2804962 RepID=A0AA38PRC8_9AGAR|nr:hypothetical protein F5890DRAFT_1477805 [Lentinula detonsa]
MLGNWVQVSGTYSEFQQTNYHQVFKSREKTSVLNNDEYSSSDRVLCESFTEKSPAFTRELRLGAGPVLVMPTTPYLATSHAAPDATVLAKISKGLGQTMNTCSFDVTGHPALFM